MSTKSTRTTEKLPLVVNLTDWEFPTDLYVHVRDELRVNPKIWIFRTPVREFIAEHFLAAEDFEILDGLCSELAQVVLFWDPDWTDEYARWVLAHELFHARQYFDRGNVGGTRWEGLSEHDEEKIWEKEACDYANRVLGQRIDKDFKRYRSDAPKSKPKRERKPKAGKQRG